MSREEEVASAVRDEKAEEKRGEKKPSGNSEILLRIEYLFCKIEVSPMDSQTELFLISYFGMYEVIDEIEKADS